MTFGGVVKLYSSWPLLTHNVHQSKHTSLFSYLCASKLERPVLDGTAKSCQDVHKSKRPGSVTQEFTFVTTVCMTDGGRVSLVKAGRTHYLLYFCRVLVHLCGEGVFRDDCLHLCLCDLCFSLYDLCFPVIHNTTFVGFHFPDGFFWFHVSFECFRNFIFNHTHIHKCV